MEKRARMRAMRRRKRRRCWWWPWWLRTNSTMRLNFLQEDERV